MYHPAFFQIIVEKFLVFKRIMQLRQKAWSRNQNQQSITSGARSSDPRI